MVYIGVLISVFTTLAVSSLASNEDVVSYRGHSVYRFTPESHHINHLNAYINKNGDNIELFGDSLSSSSHNDVRVSPEVAADFVETMSGLSIDYKLMNSDLQDDIDNERREIEETPRRNKRTSLHFDFHNYHTYPQILSYLKHFCTISEFDCDSYSIGKTLENRELYVIQLGTPGPNKKVVWLDGGIHAREWITPATVLNMLHLLSRKNNETEALFKRHVFYVLPVLNPDGYVFSWTKNRMWRKNRTPNSGSTCFGVDLNRNWGFLWGIGGSSDNPCSNVYHGKEAFSEKETTIVSNFILKKITPTKNFRLFLSLHSNSQKWLVPYAVSKTNRPKNLRNLIYIAHRGIAAQKEQGLDYGIATPYTRRGATAGQSYDWAKGSASARYSYILELPLKQRYGFLLPKRFIEPVKNQTWAALKMVLNEITRLEKKNCAIEL